MEKVCCIEGCACYPFRNGYCYDHWQAWKREQYLNRPRKVCLYDGCDKYQYNRGYCQTHFRRFYKNKKVSCPLCSGKGCDTCCYLGKIN